MPWDEITITWLFKKKQYTVTIDYDDWENVLTWKISHWDTISSTMSWITQPSKSWYTFEGWYNTKDWKIFDLSNDPVKDNITLKPKWKKNSSWWGWGGWGWSSDIRKCRIEDFTCEENGKYRIKPSITCRDSDKIWWSKCKEDEEEKTNTWETNTWKIEEPTNTWTIEEIPELNSPEEKPEIAEITFCKLYYNPVKFTDIDDSFAKEYIDYLSDKWIVHWYTDNEWMFNQLYKPKQATSRIEFLKIVLGFRCDEKWRDYTRTPFNDIEPGSWHARVINRSIELNLISSDNTEFRPDEPISREEAIKILMLAWWISPKEWAQSPFVDVDWWSAWYIKWAVDAWLINANTPEFRPTDPISREESAKIVYEFIKLATKE